MFKNKTLLITGGTGSFGSTELNRFLESDNVSVDFCEKKLLIKLSRK